MRIPIVLLGAMAALPVWSQEPVVAKASFLPDTVKRGEMRREVRGLGEVANQRIVTLRIAETVVADVRAGQPVRIDTGQKSVLAGKVARVGSTPQAGVVLVDVRLDAPLPQGVEPGLKVDGSIFIEKLADVVYVGRPVYGRPNTAVTLFKIEPDGEHATRVKVRFGRTSVSTIEVLEGLAPGDRVILSDMRAFDGQSRIRLQ